MTAVATLNGSPITRATVVLPRWGIWWADVECEDDAIAAGGPASLILGGVTFTGTVVDGAAFLTKGYYRIVGGAGGWRNILTPEAYRGEIGIKLSAVIGAAAREVGETLGTFTDSVVGGSFVRPPKSEAARCLDLLVPELWYVDEAGVTQVGKVRPVTLLSGEPYALLEKKPDRRYAMIGRQSLVGIVPGVTIEGWEIGSVRHELTTDSLRTHVWGVAGASPGDRVTQALLSLFRRTMRPTWYHGRYRYRVTGQSGGYLDLSPIDSALGLPSLSNVPMGAGSPGASGDPQTGSTVRVMFADGNPTIPEIVSFDGPSAGGFLPTRAALNATGNVELGAATGRPLRSGDKIMIPGVQPGPGVTGIVVLLDPSVVAPGPGPAGYSQVKA